SSSLVRYISRVSRSSSIRRTSMTASSSAIASAVLLRWRGLRGAECLPGQYSRATRHIQGGRYAMCKRAIRPRAADRRRSDPDVGDVHVRHEVGPRDPMPVEGLEEPDHMPGRLQVET